MSDREVRECQKIVQISMTSFKNAPLRGILFLYGDEGPSPDVRNVFAVGGVFVVGSVFAVGRVLTVPLVQGIF